MDRYLINNRIPKDQGANLEHQLEKFFKLKTFRDNQRPIIIATKQRKDVFVCMPTGGGKSLTFQLAALTDPGTTIVIVPLLSLIRDQVSRLQELNLSAVALSGIQTGNNLKKTLEDIQNAKNPPKLIYMTPERAIQNQCTYEMFKTLNRRNLLDRFVVDESHCVSEWGKDFRPQYLNLSNLRRDFPSVPIMALTATASGSVREDVVLKLGMKDPVLFQCSFNRKNLIYEVRDKLDDRTTLEQAADFIDKNYLNKSGIIYCTTTENCEKVAQNLREIYGLDSCAAYHGKMEETERNKIQDLWMKGAIKIIVATIAFGMGIDKSDVRFVIHFNLSKSIESYYQESGRAGRDGERSHCIIFYSYRDREVLDFLNQKSAKANTKLLKELTEQINKMIIYCKNRVKCRRVLLLDELGEKFDGAVCEKMCDNCFRDNIDPARSRQNLMTDLCEEFEDEEELILLSALNQRKAQSQSQPEAQFQGQPQGQSQAFSQKTVENSHSAGLMFSSAMFLSQKDKENNKKAINISRKPSPFPIEVEDVKPGSMIEEEPLEENEEDQMGGNLIGEPVFLKASQLRLISNENKMKKSKSKVEDHEVRLRNHKTPKTDSSDTTRKAKFITVNRDPYIENPLFYSSKRSANALPEKICLSLSCGRKILKVQSSPKGK